MNFVDIWDLKACHGRIKSSEIESASNFRARWGKIAPVAPPLLSAALVLLWPRVSVMVYFRKFSAHEYNADLNV